jgi:hypothetical protein
VKRRIIPEMYLVMIDYGQRGREAVTDPEITRAGVIDRLRSGEYQKVSFILRIVDGLADDCTDELIEAAEQMAREVEAA